MLVLGAQPGSSQVWPIFGTRFAACTAKSCNAAIGIFSGRLAGRGGGRGHDPGRDPFAPLARGRLTRA